MSKRPKRKADKKDEQRWVRTTVVPDDGPTDAENDALLDFLLPIALERMRKEDEERLRADNTAPTPSDGAGDGRNPHPHLRKQMTPPSIKTMLSTILAPPPDSVKQLSE
jgi:hypothetical protein